MPDYRRSPVFYHQTEAFRGWMKWKGYTWPVGLHEQERMIIEEMRDMHKVFADSSEIKGFGDEGKNSRSAPNVPCGTSAQGDGLASGKLADAGTVETTGVIS